MSTELELQQKYQKILNTCKKDLYNMYKINWNDKDSIKYTYGEGSFTVNSVTKVANPSNNIVFILFEEKWYQYTGEVSYTIHMLKLNEGDKLKFTNCAFAWNRCVKSLCTQQDINSARKAATSYCIIQVPRSSIINKKEKTIQDFINNGELFNNRVKVTKGEDCADLVKINGKSYWVDESRRWVNIYDNKRFCEKLDKSGYYTEVFKLRRLSKLTKIHSNQIKEYLKSVDYQNKIKELKELLNRVKEVYISKLQKAETYKQVCLLKKHFTLERFYSSFEDIQDFVKNTLDPNYDRYWRMFNNIQEFKGSYSKTYNEINTCIKELNMV